MTPVDALVVGAGPAGSIAALRLARAGLRVRILDRATFPRDKLCGDTLNPGSLAILDRLGAGAAVRRHALRTAGMTVTGPGAASVSANYPRNLCGAAIARRHLDLILLQAAVDAGAQFESGVTALEPVMADGAPRVTGLRVSSRGADHRLRCGIVIAADGRGSRLATKLGLARFARSPRRWAYGAYYAGVERLTSHGEMHIRPDGYVGIAPLPGSMANVCVVRAASRRRDTLPMPPPQVIGTAVASDPLLRDRFRDASRISDVIVLGPLAIESSVPGCAGLLLAGDSAGFVDPMTGDGMRFALRGGELAAEAAMEELASGRAAFENLAAARTREFAGKWRVNRALRTLVDSPRALELAALIAKRWAMPVEYLIGVAGDVSLANAGPWQVQSGNLKVQGK